MAPPPTPEEAELHQHPMRVVMRRTGLNADLLRVWEKRYGVVRPLRTPNGRRLYSDAEIERLRLLYRATLAGRSIGQVAMMPTGELADLVRKDEMAERPASEEGEDFGRAQLSPSVSPYLEECSSAIEELDAVTLDATLRRAVVTLPATVFLERLVAVLLQRVGGGWRAGTLRPVHGSLAFSVLRRALDRVLESAASPRARLHAVAATPVGEVHEFGAMLAAATAATEGWRVTYLGAGLPAEDLAEAMRKTGAEALLLSLVYPPGDVGIAHELRRLGTLLPPGTTVLAGGAAAPATRSVLEEMGAELVMQLGDLRERLRAGGFG